jgi:quercetin dioxygenase-like cupin family protein
MIDLVHLASHESGTPPVHRKGTGVVAVSSGLVQVRVGGRTPAVRRGEVLVADSERVEGWRNLGQAEVMLFWIVIPPTARMR